MSNALDTLRSDLVGVAPDAGFEAASWLVTAADVPDAGALLDSLAGAAGWLMLPDALFTLKAGAWRCASGRDPGAAPTVPELAARALEAEFVLSAGLSLHLRRVGGRLRRYDLREGAGGDAVLVEERSHVSTERLPGFGRLRYRVAWRPVSEGTPEVFVLRPWVARFSGWED